MIFFSYLKPSQKHFLLTCLSTDVAYVVNKLSRYTNNLEVKHWQGITRVLKYLRFTHDYGPHFTRFPTVLKGYNDANWIF